jgi:uncharacterized phage infection (PIP) family protein YhgE
VDSDFDGAGDACDSHFDAGTAVDAAETTVTRMSSTLIGISTLSGANGMIAKLQRVVARVNDAVNGIQAGTSSLAQYTATLDGALAQLTAFDNQLDAKTRGSSPQIGGADAGALRSASTELRTLIENLKSHPPT